MHYNVQVSLHVYVNHGPAHELNGILQLVLLARTAKPAVKPVPPVKVVERYEPTQHRAHDLPFS